MLQFGITGLSGTSFSQDTTNSPRSVIVLLSGFSFENMPFILSKLSPRSVFYNQAIWSMMFSSYFDSHFILPYCESPL